ncbi:MAG: DUF4332 domain-containing protein [Candidatus Thorarchaeota archaeon]|jgi:hypothetical protein
MDQESFRDYLRKRRRKSKSAIESILEIVLEYERFLNEEGIDVERAKPEDLERFVIWVEEALGQKANRRLWAVTVYYEFLKQPEMARHAGSLRGRRIKQQPFRLAKFRGVNLDHADRLERIGIKNVEHMIQRGDTPKKRIKIAEETEIPLESVLEFVKLSDLTRIGAVKTVRARLYYDSGVDTIEKLAQYDSEELRTYLQEWIEKSGFEGIAPLPKEAANAVATAKKLPRLVDFE